MLYLQKKKKKRVPFFPLSCLIKMKDGTRQNVCVPIFVQFVIIMNDGFYLKSITHIKSDGFFVDCLSV